MSRNWLVVSGISGALAIALGAFGAHALRAWLPLQQMTIFETAVRYQLVHTLALLATALAMGQFPERARALVQVAWLFLLGIVLFSGSLYVLALTGARSLGAVTPFGGAAFIAGWVLLALAVARAP